MSKPKVLVVLGPTATGKSALAVELALALCGEVVSADSRQTYRGLDLGSGKVTEKEMKGVPHHLLDVAHPAKPYTVEDFRKAGHAAISEILAKGKTPIIAGGTGFYIDALTQNVEYPDVKPDGELRKKLAKHTAATLLVRLRKLDPKRAKAIDPYNKVRIIRAIEIAKALGSVPKAKSKPLYDVHHIGIDLPDDVLKRNIAKRLNGRLKKGMLAEVKRLHEEGVSWKRLLSLGLEYRYATLHLTGIITKKEMVEKLNTETWHFVRRQRMWFKRNTDIVWYRPEDFKKILRDCAGFLGQ